MAKRSSAPYYKEVATRRTSAFLGVLLLLVAMGCDRGSHPTSTGIKAPDFTVSDNTSTIRLADYRGKIVLVNFWASWCPPCIQETPSLVAFHHAHPEYPILAVSIDENEAAYRRFIEQKHFDVITVRDPDQTVASKYGTTGWPETFVIDRNGVIRRRFVSAQDWNDPEIVNYLKTL